MNVLVIRAAAGASISMTPLDSVVVFEMVSVPPVPVTPPWLNSRTVVALPLRLSAEMLEELLIASAVPDLVRNATSADPGGPRGSSYRRGSRLRRCPNSR